MRTSCIRLRANSRLAILFEDFLEICDGDLLAALLLAILVYWTDIKIAKKDTNLWIWKSHEDFQEDLMVDKPGMKPPHRTTISSKLDFLQAKDFIEWRKNPKLALDRTRHYLVHQAEVQAAVDRLPPIVSRKTDIRLLENRHSEEDASEATSDDLTNVEKPTFVVSRKTDNAMSEKQHCIVGKPTSNTNDYITEITDSVITEEREGATAPTRAEISRKVEKRITHPQIQAVSAEMVASQQEELSDSQCLQEDEQPTMKLAAMKGVSHADRVISPALPAESRDSGTHPGQHVALQRATAAQTLIPEPVHADGAASAALPLGGAISATSSGPRRRGKSPVPQRPPQLTLEGVQAKEWYEEIRDVKVRMTAGNVKDLNDLGECEGLSKHSLAAMIEHLENKKWVKDNQVAISLHMLSGNDARFAFLSFEENWSLIKRKLNGKKPQSRPTLDEVECIDERWCVYKRPGDDQEWILWQGELCTPEEADERGYAGGGGLYIQTQYAK